MKPTRRGGPMGCLQVGRLLQRYLDEMLDEPRAHRLALHLDECRRCGLEAETYRRIKASLGETSGRPLSTDAVARLTLFADGLSRGEEPTSK